MSQQSVSRMIASLVFEVISFDCKRGRALIACVRFVVAFPRVREPVLFERVLASEGLGALPAHEGLASASLVLRLVHVEELDVLSERRGVRECLCAVGTDLAAAHTVNALVHIEVVPRGEGASTSVSRSGERAAVPFHVHFAVFVQIGLAPKRQITARKIAAPRGLERVVCCFAARELGFGQCVSFAMA